MKRDMLYAFRVAATVIAAFVTLRVLFTLLEDAQVPSEATPITPPLEEILYGVGFALIVFLMVFAVTLLVRRLSKLRR